MSLGQVVLNKLLSILRDGKSVALHEPLFIGNEKLYLEDCIDSNYVSSVGNYVSRFEDALAHYTGARRAIAVMNGTAALQLSLQLAGIKKDDEVIMPTLTFVGTANAVNYLGATPHFADSDEHTLGLDPRALRDWLKYMAESTALGYRNRFTGRRLGAVVCVHTFGHPCDVEGLMQVAHDYMMPLLEDAAESLGSLYQSKHTGTFGLLGALSFNGNKIITTGGGGAILTNDERLADHAKHLSTTAKVPHIWDYVHDEVGYNLRLPNLNAALGCAQLENLPTFLNSKRRLFNVYRDAFQSLDDLNLVQEPLHCRSNYWFQTLLLAESAADQRDEILKVTNDAGIMTRPAWCLMHELLPYQHCPSAPLPCAESLVRRLVNIPSSAGLV